MLTENELLIIVICAVTNYCCYNNKVIGKRPDEYFLFDNVEGRYQKHYL